jgi:hypothetical protein
MKLGLTERQYKLVISEVVKSQEIEEQGEPVNSEPEAGTSAQQSGGQGYPAVGKWESGVTRGPGNQIGNTKWSDIVGASLKRGKANPLKEQSDYLMDKRGNALANSVGIRSDKDYNLVNKTLDDAQKMTSGQQIDPHTRNMILGIATAFIPYVGPFISAGIGVYDAKLYYDEGDTKTAGMVAMFSVIPGISAIKTAIPLVKTLGTKGMALLGSKLSKGVKIVNPQEIEIVNSIRKYRPLIQQELNKKANELSIMAAKNNVKKQITTQSIKKGAGNLGKSVAGYGAAGVGYNYSFDYVVRKQEEANLKILNKKLGLTN